MSAAWAAANPDKVREIWRRHEGVRRVSRWAEQLVYVARSAKKVRRFGATDIDAAYLHELFEQQRGRCYWLDIPMIPSAVARDPRRPSLDRLDNAVGYVRDNVVLASQFANLGRSSCPADAFEDFTRELRSHLAQQVG